MEKSPQKEMDLKAEVMKAELDIPLREDEENAREGEKLSDHSALAMHEIKSDSSMNPWWIDFMKEEGLFEDDTNTIFKDGAIISMDQAENLKDTSLINEKRAHFQDDVDQDEAIGDDDDNDEDSVEEESEDDLKERLWVVARNHWNYDYTKRGSRRKDSSTNMNESEMALLQPAIDDHQDQERIQTFRNHLLACIYAYNQVFGDVNTSDDKEKSPLHAEARMMSPYVPLAVARRLFVLVLRSIKTKEKEHMEEAEETGEGSRPRGDNFFYFVEHVTQILFSPELGIFRTYIVEPQTSAVEKMKKGSEGKRIRTDGIADDRQRQRDTERLLYGDMYAEEKKQDGDDLELEGGDPDGPEEEVRVRKGIAPLIGTILEDEQFLGRDTDWTGSFVQEVLLNGLLQESLPEDSVAVSNFLSARLDRRSHTTLAYMYAIRYFPHFFVRSFWKKSSTPTLNLLAKYFADSKIIRSRLIVLGIYTGVLVHIGELNALFKDICVGDAFDTAHWDEFLRNVHRSIASSLSLVLEENMRSADFLPSKTVHGIDWKFTEIKDNPSFKIEEDHPQIVSVCLEIGRSFHFQGINLGKMEQDRMAKSTDLDVVFHKRSFDDRMTELEVDAYLEAQSAFNGSLKVLQRAEKAIKERHLSMLEEARAREEDDPLRPSKKMMPIRKFDASRSREIKHIHEARITIELYLSDTLTTLAYCYEAKLSEFSLALKCYNDSLVFYSKHIGRSHPTVFHSLQCLGMIHMELKQWKEAARCLIECINLMKQRLPPGTQPIQNGVFVFKSISENRDMATLLQCLGVVRSELGDHDASFDCLSKSIDQMALTVLRDKLPQDNSIIVRPPSDPFISDSLSKMVASLFEKLNSLKYKYVKRRLTMLYGEEEELDVESFDEPRLSRLQVERRAIEIARDAVRMRRIITFGDDRRFQSQEMITNDFDPSKTKRVQWFDVLDLMRDLLNLGKLLFRRRDYADSIDCWKEALSLMENAQEKNYDGVFLCRSVKLALAEYHERRINTMGELTHLIGIALCRIGGHEDACNWFEKSLSYLEEKRRIFAEKGAEKNQKGPSDEDWDILDMDVGYSEHALGLSYSYNNQLTAATAHYRESLRLFESIAARRKGRINLPQSNLDNPDHKQSQGMVDQRELDVSINYAIAAVMLSLGSLYHEQQKFDRARRFLEGAIQVVYSTTHRILSASRGASFSIKSVTCFNNLSLIVSIVRVGDAHRRIAMMSIQKNNIEEAKLAFETAMRYLESTNIESKLSLSVDDETHLESVGQPEIDGMLLSCYEQMMTIISNSAGDEPDRKKSSWWNFGIRAQDDSRLINTIGGLTKEDMLFRLGNIFAKQEKLDSAIRCFLEARELTEERLETSDHAIIGNILFNLGVVYKKIYNGRLEKTSQKAKECAIDAFVESLRIAKLTLGPDSLSAAEVMEELASILMQDESNSSEDYVYQEDDGATKFLRDAVSIRTRHRSEMNLPYARSMHHLGLLRLRQQLKDIDEDISSRDDKKLDESITCLSHALRVRKTLLGDHLDVANTANSLGVALWKRATSPNGSKHATLIEAMKQLNDSLYIRTSFLEKSNYTESVASNSSKYNAWRKDLDGTEDIGSVVLKTVENMYDIARVHESEGNHDAQSVCLKDAMQLLDVWTEKLFSSVHKSDKPNMPLNDSSRNIWKSKLLYGLGLSRIEVGEYSNAILHFEESLKLRGLDPIETATANEVFDNFFRQDSDQPKRKGAVLTPLSSAIAMEKLAFAYCKVGKDEDALKFYAFCLQVYGEHFGHLNLKVANILRHIGKVYQDRHDYKRCVRSLQRALHINDELDGPNKYIPRLEDAIVYMQLARSLVALGAYDDVALEHFQSGVGILEDVNQIHRSRSTAKASLTPRKGSDKLEFIIIDDHNTHELLLEGYSSILSLLRRRDDDGTDNDDLTLEVIHSIGNTHAALGQYDKALKSLNRVLQHQRETKGSEHLTVADLLFNLGNIHVEMGQLAEARNCHHECHVISTSILGSESVELAENMVCLGNVEYLDNNFTLSLEWLEGALRLLQSRADQDVAIAKCLHRKALVHDKVGEYEQSIDCFNEVLRLGRKIWGMHHFELSNILNSVGNVHQNHREIGKALKCYEESLRIRSQSGDKLSVASAKNNIGALFVAMDNTARARQFYADALRIKTELLGPEHVETSRTLYNMGQLYFAEKKYSQSLRFFNEALQVLNLVLGENHNEVAACLCSIGTVYDDMSQEDLALSYFKKALSSVKGQTGAKSVRASALHNIGIILTKRHDIDHAVRIFREALELKLSDSGADDCSDTQYNLANVLRLTGCINEAVKLHKSALDTRLQYLGPDHVDVANSLFGLSQAFVDSGNHREAVKILTECVKIRKKIYGEQSDLFADANFILGTVLREVGNLSESLRCLKAALEVKALTCGESSDEVAEISFKLAIVLCEVGKYEEAKSYNAKSLAIRENTTASSSYEIALILENMGTIEQKLGEHVLALERLKQAIEIKEASGGEGDHDVGQILHTMAISYFELEKYDHAIRFFEDAAKRKKRTFGPKSIEVARVLVDEGRVFERVGEHERALMCYEEAVDSDCFEDDSWELGRVFMRMGITHFALRKAEDAWDCLAEATRIFESVERRGKRVKEGSGRPSTRTTRDLHDLIKCYECIIRLSETNATRYNIDRSLVLPKVANVLVEIKEYQKASLLYQDAIVLLRSLPGDTRFIVATNLHNLGNCLHHLGDFNDALTSLEDALGLFQDIPGIEGKHVADTYHSLGVIHQSRSDMHEALTCYSNVLKSKRGDSKDGNVPLVSTLVSMGEVLRTLGMYDAAIKSCKDALRVLETKGESKQLMVARIVQCIGRTHKDRFEYEKSIRCHLESIKQYQDCLGSNNISTGKAIHELALVYTLKGDYEKAAEQFQQAYHIFKNYIGFGIQEHDKESQKGDTGIKLLSEAITNFSEKCQGEFFIEDADAVLGLGSIMDNIGMKEEAMLCHELAVKMIDDRLGSNHLSSALGKHRMGVMLFKKGLFEDSVSRLREALQTRRSKLGDNHIDTEDTLKTLSRAYAASGNSEMALFYFKEVVNIRKTRSSNKTDSDSEADLLLRLGKLHLEQQEYADALTCFKDSLRMQRQLSINREEQKLGETLLYMGWTLVEIDQFQEARLTLLSALRLLESGQDESKDLMNASYLLGRINEEERAFDKALAWYDRSLVILNSIDSADFQMKARLLLRIGMLKFSQESFDDALQFVNEAQDLFSSCNGTQNLEYSDCVHSRGLIHFEIQEFSAAKEFFQLALQIRQQHLKTDDLEVGNSFHFLGAVLTELEQFEEARSCLEEALRIRRLSMGDSAFGVGETRRFLGSVELHLGNSKESTDNYLEAVRIGLEFVGKRQAISDKEYGNLLGCFDAVIPMAKNGIYSESLGKLYHQKGSLQIMHKKFKQALNSFTEAIQVYKAEYGEDHLNVANALFNVGVCLKETGDTERAMKCFARALSITSEQLGEYHVEVADTTQQMAEVYRMKGDLKGAIKMCEQALDIRRNVEDETLAALLNFSGEVYTSLEISDEAERSFRECVRIRKKMLGDDSLEVAQALYSLGYVLEIFRKDYKRALRCFEESLRIRINLSLDKNQETARCFLHLGNTHAALRSDSKAFFCFDKAISLCKEVGISDVFIVEDAILGRGHALLASGKLVESLVQYEKARHERQERAGDNKENSKEVADIFVYEAIALQKLGRQGESLNRLLQALDMYKETVGMDHLGTAGAYQRLAELHLDMEEYNEALGCAQQALTIRKSRLGKHDEATGESYFVIGKIFFATMDLETSKPCLEAALEIFRQCRGSNHPSTADAMYFNGCVHEFYKDWDGAIIFFQEALPIRQKNLGRDHLLVADILFKLGTSHKKRDEFELASDCLSECLRIRTNAFGQEHQYVADTLFELAGALRDSVQVSGKLDPSQCYVDAIRIYRLSLGESHVKVAKCLSRLGDILERKKETKKAGNCYEKAVAIFEVKLKADPTPEIMRDYNVERDYEAYAEVLLDWAKFLDNTGNDGSAMKTYRRALGLLQIIRADDSDLIDNTLCRIANVLGRQGRAGEAMQLLDQVKERRISAVGENHPLVADVYFSISHVLEKNRDYQGAVEALETTLRIRRATLGPFSEEVGSVLTQIGIVQAHATEFAKAIRTWDEALAIYNKAGLLETDLIVLDVREHQQNAKHMLESIET